MQRWDLSIKCNHMVYPPPGTDSRPVPTPPSLQMTLSPSQKTWQHSAFSLETYAFWVVGFVQHSWQIFPQNTSCPCHCACHRALSTELKLPLQGEEGEVSETLEVNKCHMPGKARASQILRSPSPGSGNTKQLLEETVTSHTGKERISGHHIQNSGLWLSPCDTTVFESFLLL